MVAMPLGGDCQTKRPHSYCWQVKRTLCSPINYVALVNKMNGAHMLTLVLAVIRESAVKNLLSGLHW